VCCCYLVLVIFSFNMETRFVCSGRFAKYLFYKVDAVIN
jgi:hypothetical protein